MAEIPADQQQIRGCALVLQLVEGRGQAMAQQWQGQTLAHFPVRIGHQVRITELQNPPEHCRYQDPSHYSLPSSNGHAMSLQTFSAATH